MFTIYINGKIFKKRCSPEGMGPAVFNVNPNHTDLNTAQMKSAEEQQLADAEIQRRRQVGEFFERSSYGRK